MMLQKLSRNSLAVAIGQHSTSGCKPINQDFHGALVPEDRELSLKGIALAIADGISSSQVSHIAAETSVKSFLSDYYCTSDSWTAKTAGHRVISATNSWLNSNTRRDHLDENINFGYICTFSALVLKGRTAHIFHVGDSRISRVADNNLEPLTSNHRTILSSNESYLARALGLSSEIEIEYRDVPLHHGDIFVMTTDGVHDHLPSSEIAALISKADDLDQAARTIVETALNNASDDNLTIQIIKVENLPSHDAASTQRNADILQPAAPPEERSSFEGYKIIRQIHGSSRSHIYIAVDEETDETVALKVPSVDQRTNPDYLRRFAMEEWIARRITSTHVLKAAPAKRERSSLFVVTKFIEGKTLRQWMVDNPNPDLETIRSIIEQIAKGLRAFHRKEMVHQDLRPENIMIDRQGTVKIIDFGAVRIAGVLEASPEIDTSEILGTHQYAAPEYFVGQIGTPRSDLYSLGVLTYELLTGHLPYGARMARASSLVQQSHVKYTPITSYRTDLPAWLDATISKAVHHNPAARQQALSEFTHDLRHPRKGAIRANDAAPVIERNPVLFWQVTTGILALLVLFLLTLR